MFTNVKNGDVVYCIELDLNNGSPKFHKASVVSVNIEDKKVTPKDFSDFTKPAVTEKMMNIIIEVAGADKEFSGLNPECDYFIGGRFRVSTDKEKLVKDIKSIKDEKQQHISKMEEYKEVVEKCDTAFEEIGFVDMTPVAPEEMKEVKKQLGSLDARVNGLDGKMDQILKALGVSGNEEKPILTKKE